MTPSDETDRQRLSAVAHASSLMWGPMSLATVDQVISQVERHAHDPIVSAIDLGCGPAELARRVAERFGSRVTAIDTSRYALDEARRRLAASGARDLVDLRLGDVRDIEAEPAFDLVACIGPGWRSGGWQRFATWASAFARQDGLLLLADGAWRTPPSADDLDRLGMAADDYLPTAEVEGAVRTAGVEPLWSHRSRRDEWDGYAAAYREALRRFSREHADDPLAEAAARRAGPGWSEFELLHAVLDFVILLCRAPMPLRQSTA
jgi:SAM-dependent methyltransferase